MVTWSLVIGFRFNLFNERNEINKWLEVKVKT